MPEVIAAKDAYEKAMRAAVEMRREARIRLGYAVVEQNKSGTSFETIARTLGVALEQVRRYRQSYLDWAHANPDQTCP